MNKYNSIVKKEFAHIFRDRFSIVLLLMLLVIQLLLFGLSYLTETKVTKMVVLDYSKDISTNRIIEKLNASRYFTLVEEVSSLDEIQRVFKANKASLAVVFSENFHDNILHTGNCPVQLISDGTQANQSFVGYATGIISDYRMELMSKNNVKSPLNILPETKMLYNPQARGSFGFTPGVIGIMLLLICTMMTAISLQQSKLNETAEDRAKPATYILAKITPYFVLAVADLCLMLLIAVFAVQIPVAGSLTLLISASLLFIVAALFLGVFIANIAKTRNAVMMISGVGLILLTVILSGMALAVESMPAVYQWVAAIHPLRWFIQIAKNVMIQGVDLVFVTKELVILACITAIIIFLSFKTFKKNLQQC